MYTLSNQSMQWAYLERLLPVMVLSVLFVIVYVNKMNSSKITVNVKPYIMGVMGFLFITHIAILIYKDQWLIDVLIVGVVVTLLLMITRSQILFNLSLITGVIGGGISLLLMTTSFTFTDFGYYFYIIGHFFNLFIPIYYYITHKQTVTIHSSIITFVVMTVGSILMVVVNHLASSNHLYLVSGKNMAPEGHYMSYLGNWPVNLIGLMMIYLVKVVAIYFIIKYIPKNENDDVTVSSNSIYMTTRK